MSQIICPNCGHSLNPSDSTNTRDKKAMRLSLLNDWFEHLKKNGAWKSRVNDSDKLIVNMARRELYILEMGALRLTPEENGEWNDSYFKTNHWSNKPRIAFEKWIQEERNTRQDRTLFRGPIDDLGIPILMLESVNTPEEAMDLIIKVTQEKQAALQEIKKYQNKINRLENTIHELRTRRDYMAEATLEEHYQNSIRTIHYAAGTDIDLSLEELIRELRKDNQE